MKKITEEELIDIVQLIKSRAIDHSNLREIYNACKVASVNNTHIIHKHIAKGDSVTFEFHNTVYHGQVMRILRKNVEVQIFDHKGKRTVRVHPELLELANEDEQHSPKS